MKLETVIIRLSAKVLMGAMLTLLLSSGMLAQGVTTSSMSGVVTDDAGSPLVGANVVAVHEPSGTRYGASSRANGLFNIRNMRIGGPYVVTVSYVGYQEKVEEDVFLRLGQDFDVDFMLSQDVIAGEEVTVIGEIDDVMNSSRTGAATYVNKEKVEQLPTIRRSTRDLTRLDPRSDGNYSFGGKNWLYNNISLDGSYFNNPFGLDDPSPGGQSGSEPIPYEAVEQVQVSIAPFDVRQGGFTGAGVNTVTKSGTNNWTASAYSFTRNESLLGNTVAGQDVVANPDLAFNQSGFSLSGPLVRDRVFFFVNAELERRDDPGSNFVASSGGSSDFGVSRVDAATLQDIRNRMISIYGYDPGPFADYIHETNNNKLLAKLDVNLNDANKFSVRYSYLDAFREQGPHPFAISYRNTGRGPNPSSLPFQKSGYRINNELNSIAAELNTNTNTFSNRFFISYNRFRDFREPFSEDFPTIEIGQDGVQYTTLGHEPFSIHNILDQDVWQFTNNFSYYSGNHVYTAGVTFEHFGFFNSFNLFRHGFFIGQSTYDSVADFFEAIDPEDPTADPVDFRGMITPSTAPFKGENIDVGQLSLYVQDEVAINSQLDVTYGLRMDVPMYFTDPVDNPFSRSLIALDADDNEEVVDQSELPGATPLLSPRIGFNYDVGGDRSMQLRGGTGIFTGKIPFVWAGNVISNPGANPNLYEPFFNPDVEQIATSDDAILQQTFDLNAVDPDFKWPQVWTTNFAVDQDFGSGLLGTVEFVYGKDINAIIMRNADLRTPVRRLADGRDFFSDENGPELNPDGAGIYVLDNTDDGYNWSLTAQLRKRFANGLAADLAYTRMEAKSQLRSTEIASVLFQSNPVQSDPNRPRSSFSEFGQRHRFVGTSTYSHRWTPNLETHFGLFFEVAEGNRHIASGGNRYSFIYAGDVNGDGNPGNDLIYIPTDQNDIMLSDPGDWAALNAFIEQDDYLSEHRGQIAERFGAVNPWYSNIDFRILQDFAINIGSQKHTMQLNFDILNVANLLNDEWGVRKLANPAALSPLTLDRFDESTGEPVFDFTGPSETYIDDPSIISRWQMQVGLRYFFQ